MATDNLNACLTFVFKIEGGYVDNPADPGGSTSLGITQKTLAAHRGHPVTKEDVRRLTKAEAGAIYRHNYWAPIRGDQLPAGVDLAVFDFAVNSGPTTAARALQNAIGERGDGHVGPATLTALANADPSETIRKLCSERLAFMRRLRTFRTFGAGWTRRVDTCQQTALGMVQAAPVDETAENSGSVAEASAQPLGLMGGHLIEAADFIPDESPAPDPRDIRPSRMHGARAVLLTGMGLSGSAIGGLADQAKEAAGALGGFADNFPALKMICLALTAVGFIGAAVALVLHAERNEEPA